MSSPIDWARNASPERPMMATNQGSTKTTSQMMPAIGLSVSSQRTDRSTMLSASAASATTITMSGPFNNTPAAIAVQNIAGLVQAPPTSSLPPVAAGHAAPSPPS